MKKNPNLHERIATSFYGKFINLTDIQKATITPLLSGRNVVLTAGTGSGKTEAAMAPLVSKYWEEGILKKNLFIIYIAPTKALVNDIEKRLIPPLLSLGLKIGVRHGDRDDLNNKGTPNILITTPESLDVLLFRKEPKLRTIKAVIIDEVHQLYNTQRGLQLSILLRRLKAKLPQGFQWVALSATIGNLSYIRDFIFGEDEEADLITFATTRKINAKIIHIGDYTKFVSLIRDLMIEGYNTKLLIFANSRRKCEQLAEVLQKENKLQEIVYTHFSSLSSEVRIETEIAFSKASNAICIATNTLELGIDIGNIDAVLLWDIPIGIDSFLQRIGRGNRRETKTNVICLITDESSNIVIDALRFKGILADATRGKLPIREPYELFGAFGQQCLSVIASDNGKFTRIADLCQLVEHKPYFNRTITEDILAELASNGFIKHHGYKNQYGADQKLYNLIDMRLIYGNYEISSQMVSLYHGAKQLGEIPAINLLRIRTSTCIQFAGKSWLVKNASIDGIHLEPHEFAVASVNITYNGKYFPPDPHNADRIWRLIHSNELIMEIFSKNLREKVLLFTNSIRELCNQNQIPYIHTIEGFFYLTFAGNLVNKAIGLLNHKSDYRAGEFFLFVKSPINWCNIPSNPKEYEGIFPTLIDSTLNQSFFQTILPNKLQTQEFLQDWLMDDGIRQILLRLSNAEAVQINNNEFLMNNPTIFN